MVSSESVEYGYTKYYEPHSTSSIFSLLRQPKTTISSSNLIFPRLGFRRSYVPPVT